ncbi:MAG: YdeI/OmpD-associated family protein [Candidatus Saccharimonadales bacterium]
MKFAAKIEIHNGNPYVLVTKARAQKLQKDWRKPLPALVQINGQPNPAWQINMMPIGDGSFYLYLDGNVRKASKTKVGDIVKVAVDFDTTYKNGPMHPMPEWFKEALDNHPAAKQNWQKLIPSRQKKFCVTFLGCNPRKQRTETWLKRSTY